LARRPPSTVDRKKQSMKKLFFALAILSISAVGFTQPLNDITNRGVVREKPVLKYPGRYYVGKTDLARIGCTRKNQ
jgi:hypothetical protein